MGRMYAPSLRPGTSDAARGSDQCAPGHDDRRAVPVFPATIMDGGGQAFELLSKLLAVF